MLIVPGCLSFSSRCAVNFKGNRCNEMQLPLVSIGAERAGLIAAVVIVVILLLVIIALVIYYTRK